MDPSRSLPDPRSRAIALAFVLVIAVGAAAVPLSVPAAADHNDPRFEVHVPEPVVTPGETVDLTVTLVNDHRDVEDRVETARDVEVRMGSKGPIDSESGPRFLGRMPDGEFRDVTFRIDVPSDVEAGTYDLPVEISYAFEFDETRTKTVNATVRVKERARFRVVSTETNLSVGESGVFNVTMENVGSAAATDASVAIESPNAVVGIGDATSATRYVGDWAPDDRKTVSYDLSVARDAEPQRYALTAEVSFETEDGAPATSRSIATGIRPRPRQEFVVTNLSSTLQVGHEGVLSGAIENRGPKPVRDTVVVFAPDDPTVDPLATEYALGRLAPGENASFRFPTTVDASAADGPRQFAVEVRYQDRNDDEQRSEPIEFDVNVAREQAFSAANVSSTLRVGSEGSVSGSIVNAGPTGIRNAVVILEADGTNVNPLETEHAVGDLAAGERASFSFDVEMADAADAGPRQFSVRVRYRDAADDVRESDPVDLRIEVGPEQDPFEITPVNATVGAGGSEILTVRLTNTANETLTDISAKLFANSPLSTGDDEAFVDGLDPGESVEIDFSVSAAASALDKTYPVSVDFQYDDADGDTLLSDTYQLPVRVRERQTGGPPVVPIVAAIVVVAALAVGYRYWQRRE